MGMGLYVHEGTSHVIEEIQTWSSSRGKIEGIQCNVGDIPILFVYAHPAAKKSDFEELKEQSRGVKVVMGDLNVNSRDASGSGRKTLEKFASKSSKIPILDEATHQLGGQPDHILIAEDFSLPM